MLAEPGRPIGAGERSHGWSERNPWTPAETTALAPAGAKDAPPPLRGGLETGATVTTGSVRRWRTPPVATVFLAPAPGQKQTRRIRHTSNCVIY